MTTSAMLKHEGCRCEKHPPHIDDDIDRCCLTTVWFRTPCYGHCLPHLYHDITSTTITTITTMVTSSCTLLFFGRPVLHLEALEVLEVLEDYWWPAVMPISVTPNEAAPPASMLRAGCMAPPPSVSLDFARGQVGTALRARASLSPCRGPGGPRRTKGVLTECARRLVRVFADAFR